MKSWFRERQVQVSVQLVTLCPRHTCQPASGRSVSGVAAPELPPGPALPGAGSRWQGAYVFSSSFLEKQTQYPVTCFCFLSLLLAKMFIGR